MDLVKFPKETTNSEIIIQNSGLMYSGPDAHGDKISVYCS